MPKSDDEILAALGGDDPDLLGPTQTVEVQGASGSTFAVMNSNEAEWFQHNLERYQTEYLFENIADLQDLDRLIALELLSYRYATWLLSGVDYEGIAFDEKAVRDHKQKVDQEIRLSKKHLAMDRKGRVDSEQQSTADFITNLLRRAKDFGVHRDEQNAKALNIFMEAKKLIGILDRSDEEELRHLGVSETAIIDWFRTVAIPEFEKIDEHFRQNQRLWIKEIN